MKNARRHSAKFPQRRRRGAVLLIVLVAITLLVGLLFFVFNVGHQVSRREELQNTADAVATGGAGWMARSMNIIALNNVGQAKMIATAYVLDAVPLAAELAIKELEEDPETDDSLAKGLQRQIDRGLPNTRLEKGFPQSASFSKVVADAVLLMPATETVFGPLWPGDENDDVPEQDYDSVQARISAVGTPVDTPSLTGDWDSSNAENEYGSDSVETLDANATAEWTANVSSEDGRFHVYAWWSSDKDGSHRYSNTTYTMVLGGGEVTSQVDQNQNSGSWVYLGTYTFPVEDGKAAVRIRVQGPPEDPNRDQELTKFLDNGLRKLAFEMAPSDDDDNPSQYDELILLDNALNSTDEIDKEQNAYDVSDVTHWDIDGRRGKAWAAALAMRDLSISTAENAGLLAQGASQQIGHDNNAGTAFLAPVQPELPCTQGQYEDFTPVLTGLFRVQLKTPKTATLELPIYDKIDRVNNLDDSLDDITAIYQDIQQNLDDVQTAQEELEGQTDWDKLSQLMLAIQGRVNDIETRRQAIENRLSLQHDDESRLDSLREKIEKTLEKIDRIMEQINGDHNEALVKLYLEQLTELHLSTASETGLTQLAMQEEQFEINEKEFLLSNLHNFCPGGGIPDDYLPHEYESGYIANVPFSRLGPYATLHQWRSGWCESTGTSKSGWGGDPEVGASSSGTIHGELIGYETYGPYRWSLDEITRSFGLVGSHTGSLDTSRFAYYVRLGANIKLAYAYGVTHEQRIRYATRWITDYETARAYAADPANRRKIIRTRYYRPIIMSSLSWTHPDWLKDSSTYWCKPGIDPKDAPPAALWVWEPLGWYDIATRRPQAVKLNDFIWLWNRSYDDVLFEHKVNLNERRSVTEKNKYIPWTIYLTSWYVFGGIQIAEEVTVSNPCNWPEGETDKPYPLLMDLTPGDYVENHDEGVRRTHYTFLGVAGRSGAAHVWPQKFTSGVPGGQSTAVAQAEVFNNLSWDFWTQNWRSQLVPVSQWYDWQDTLAEGVDDLPTIGNLDTGDNAEWNTEENIRAVVETLQRLDPSLVQVFMNH